MADEALSNELLALAGEDDNHIKHSRKRQASGTKGSNSKRRKHEMMTNSDSDGSVESEQEAHDEYPLEGKFRDEEDRENLLGLPEIKREAILSKRMEDLQKEIERKNIERMVKFQAAGATTDLDSVSRAAKRKHTTVGASKEKSKTLEALKQKRQAKESRRARKGHDSDSPAPRRRRSESPSTSSDDEDGQVSRRRIDDASSVDGAHGKADEKITLQDLNKARITRDALEKQCMSDRFEEYVKGGWVRILVGMDRGENVYRLVEIVDISPDLVEPYKINEQTVNQRLEVRHGAVQGVFPMSKISCGPFTEREFERLMKAFETDKIKPPTRSKLEKKGETIRQIEAKPRTELEIANMLARQKEIRKGPRNNELYSRKSGLTTQRGLALKRNEHAEANRLAVLLAQIDEELAQREIKDKPDALARVNERNRKANMEAMRKADLETAARRRREMAGGPNFTMDLSARVRTVVKTRFDSRAGTPGTPGTPNAQAAASTAPGASGASAAVGGRSKGDDLARSVIIEDLF